MPNEITYDVSDELRRELGPDEEILWRRLGSASTRELGYSSSL
jgi:hypothetical protein